MKIFATIYYLVALATAIVASATDEEVSSNLVPAVEASNGGYLRSRFLADSEDKMPKEVRDENDQDRGLGQCKKKWDGCGSDSECCGCHYCGLLFKICWPIHRCMALHV